jgi:hypothetical protein
VGFEGNVKIRAYHVKDAGKGLIISGIPKDPRAVIKQSYIAGNRPLLYITPSKLKGTGSSAGGQFYKACLISTHNP